MVTGLSVQLSARHTETETEKATDPVKYIHIPDNPCKSSECMDRDMGRGDKTTYLLARWRANWWQNPNVIPNNVVNKWTELQNEKQENN